MLMENIEEDGVEKRLSHLIQMEEECFVAIFHQTVKKQRQKEWHDRHIMDNPFKVRGLVLLYDNNFFKHPGKLKTHWLGPYLI